MPREVLTAIYKAAIRTSPAFIMPNDSLAKVLKVVKPPQKPVTSNIFISGERMPLFPHPTRKPMASEPQMLTINVPNGKDATFKPDNRYLHTEPTAPPKATKSI